MATETYAPSTGYYSRSDILKARQTGGKEGSRIVSDASQAKAGDYVWSGNGTSSTPAGTSGTGLSTGGAQTVKFDTDKQYNATIAAKNALLEQNYNTTLNTLKNNYDTNMSTANLQRDEIGANYQDAVDTIHQQTYDEAEARKVLSAQRGIMNSEQALASRQGVVRRGNDSINSATKERNQMLNELSTKIANLTKAYGNDVATAQTNYGLGQTQALNEALAQKLQADMSLGMFNVGEQNKFGLQQQGFQHEELMQGRQFEQDVKMFGLNSALQLQIARMQEAGANARASAGNALAKERWEWEKGQTTKAEAEAKKEKVYELKMAMLKSNPNYDPSAKTTRMDRFLHGSTYVNPATKINQEIAKLTTEYGELNDVDFLNKYLNDSSYSQDWYNWADTPSLSNSRTQYINSLTPTMFRP
jgi:hypothetical protein